MGKRVGVSHVSLTGDPRVPSHSGVFAQQLQVDSLMDRDYLLQDHQALLVLNAALSPPVLAVGKGSLSPEETKLQHDRQTLKEPCSW